MGEFKAETFEWLYLEPILSNDEGELGARFRKIDQGFRQVTRIFEADARLSALLQSTRLQAMLDSISDQLVACQSSLNQYIDEKRATFPRLYFLSDEDLLELLGQARAGAEGRELVMQSHLKKLFPGATGVKLGPGGTSITALCSHYDEVLQLERPVDIDCPVEVWLKNLETEMRSSLKNLTLKCVVTNSLQNQDPFSLPTQILCLAQNIRFTEQAEKAIASKDLQKLNSNIEKENLNYASAEMDDVGEKQKRQALMLQCAYYMSVIRTLISNNVTSTNDWHWQRQLRFYLSNNKEVVGKMALAEISYSYEYLGVNTGQFVRTELADECFLMLTQSLHLGLVGNPFGPAGTGKTESVKALGSLFGRLVLIFNCDEAMDAQCMGRLLTGLALSGAWGCFDEFNRLTADTLATVSHQFSSLLATTNKTSDKTALLNGKHIQVSPWCGVAATMNPVGRGYGGRRALPAALERVMRPIAMVQPGAVQLAGQLLAATCHADATRLATDLHDVFAMAQALLSGERHYDWGLRAVKAAVGSCGAALAAESRGGAAAASQPRAVMRRVLQLNYVPGLTQPDAERFKDILSMVFADVPEETTTFNPISSALEQAVKTLGVVPNAMQLQKCKEVYEQLQQRMGVVIDGPPGSGKTTIRRLLKAALAQQGRTIVEYTICPKAMCRNWLLGHIDPDTRQWSDGVISATALEVSNQPAEVWSWVVCDGDIDPEWIEALNSVLDDNRLLTLPSGWRIQFGANVNFIFETHSLEYASPATVSRMGIILLSDETSCALEVMECWLLKVQIENESAKMSLPLLRKVINKCIEWFSAHRSDVLIKTYHITVVKQILTQFEYIAQNVGVSVLHTTPEELVYLALERSVTCLLKPNAFDGFYSEMSSLLGPAALTPAREYEWVSDTLLLSARLQRVEASVRAAQRQHVLLIGAHASANKLIVEHVLKETNCTVIWIECTPMLEPADIIAELRRNNVSGSGRSGVTLVVKSLHRARLDPWGCSAVHSFLLHLIHNRGYWRVGSSEESGAEWCTSGDIRVVAMATVPPPMPRLKAALPALLVPEPDDEELLELTRNFLKQNTNNKNIPGQDIMKLATNVISMFKEVTESFNSREHYQWNPSHIKRWCENTKWYSPSNTEELTQALCAEANMIFKHRLVTDDDKSLFSTLCRKHLSVTSEGIYVVSKLRGDGVYMETTDHREWYQITQRLINQCSTEHENNVFGDTGVEVCTELAILCPAIARVANGGITVCVGSTGIGRSAAAQLVATSLPATLFIVNHSHQFQQLLKNALQSASDCVRTIIVLNEEACNEHSLAVIETLLRTNSMLALPPNVRVQNAQLTLEDIKQYLGIVICLDKDQENINELFEKYPLLYNDSYLVWLERWSDETLRQMPQLIIQRLIKENVSDPSDHHEAIPVEQFVNIYNTLDSALMRAPGRYTNFIRTYYHIVTRKKAALVQRQKMLLLVARSPPGCGPTWRTRGCWRAAARCGRRRPTSPGTIASRALAAWVRANLAHARVLARCGPLRAAQADLTRNLQEAEAQLAALSSGLATVDERVASLKEQLGRYTKDAASIEVKLSGAKETIHAARTLLDQLMHEYSAWEHDLENISKEISEVNLRSLLSAAYIVYLPEMTEPQAREHLDKWGRLIEFSDATFSVINFLTSPEKQLKWQADGLPLDNTAVKNAVVIQQYLESPHCGFTPLIIDPDGEAMSWLKKTLSHAQCDFISQNSDKLHTAVQYAVRLGRTLVITDVDDIHPTWSPLLSGVGGNTRLLLCGGVRARHLPVYYASRLALTYFTARLHSLTDQLVHCALQQQNPEVNEKSKEMRLKKASLQKQQHELQENLLRDLSSNRDILHDANLLESLKKTRATSATISEALEAAKSIEMDIKTASEAYEASAYRASILSLAVKRLATSRPLLSISIDTIMEIFVDAVRRDSKTIDNDEIVRYVTRRIIDRVVLALHKKDKYTVVLHLLKEVYDSLIPEKLWQILIGNQQDVDDKSIMNEIKNNHPWIPDECLKNVAQIKVSTPDVFTRMSLQNEELWTSFLRSGDLRLLGRLQLSGFELVTAVWAIRADTLYRAMVAFVDQLLGSGALSPRDSVSRAAAGPRRTRAALILGSHALDVLAAHSPRLIQVGIDEGRSGWERALDSARGGWLALVVGASPFTQELMAFFRDFIERPAEEFSEDFRLWIVCEERDVPPLISSACVNVILEAPEGVKHNAISTLSAWSNYQGDAKLVQSLARLALFHAIVQERRAYIPQGWSRYYRWEWGDVSLCMRIVSLRADAALCLAAYCSRAERSQDTALLDALFNMTHVHLPLSYTVQEYISKLSEFPDTDSSELLGLPDNCRVAWERNTAANILTGLKEMSTTATLNESTDKSAPLKNLLALWKKLMIGNPLLKGDFQITQLPSGWWGCVVGGEVRDVNTAARGLHASLTLLAKTRTPLLQVPESWHLLWPGPTAPDVYIKEFCHRARAALARLNSNQTDIPQELDFRSLMDPCRAAWSLRARTARRRHCRVHDLHYVLSDAADTDAESVLVGGLSAQGAAWAGGALSPAPRAAPPRAPAPPLRLRCLTQHKDMSHSEAWLQVPVYNNEARDELIFTASVQLARDFKRDTAVLNAIALFVTPLE